MSEGWDLACYPCRNGVHDHMDEATVPGFMLLSKFEQRESLDCKNGVIGEGQCVCPSKRGFFDE